MGLTARCDASRCLSHLSGGVLSPCYRGENEYCDPCTKRVSLNDDIRAIAIKRGEVVEVYEHCGFGGWRLDYQGPGRWVFPADHWDKASAIAAN